ncbi:MAG: hypothetical protein RLZZ282_1728, partial [Verrucomicrobiota bacterium]
MNTNKFNQLAARALANIDRTATHANQLAARANAAGDKALTLSRKLRRHPIATSMLSLAMVGLGAFTISSYCATPAPAPVGAPKNLAPVSRTFDFDITVPLFYNGQNIGSTVIPKGNSVDVLGETATSITIRHMEVTLTITKPGKAPVTPMTSTVAPKMTAQPVKPAGTSNNPAPTRDTSHDAEHARMSKIPERKLPYPIQEIVIEADGTYTVGQYTHNFTYSYERIGTKLRLLNTTGSWNIWEVEEANTFESIFKTDPKLQEAIVREAPNHGPNWTEEIIAEETSKKTRILMVPNKMAIPANTPIKDVLTLIAKRDPRM